MMTSNNSMASNGGSSSYSRQQSGSGSSNAVTSLTAIAAKVMQAQALSSVLLFNKSLTTMVKGIRAARERGSGISGTFGGSNGSNSGGLDAEQQYINACVTEIAAELQSPYSDIKAAAIQKLIYVHMCCGRDMKQYAFHIVECMASASYAHKRVAYLAATLVFTQHTDVILLTTHLFRKAFTQQGASANGSSSISSATTSSFFNPFAIQNSGSSGNLSSSGDSAQYECGSALNCFATIVTPDLAASLLPDIHVLLTSSRPYIRKRATLALLNVYRQHPEHSNNSSSDADQMQQQSFDRVCAQLSDSNSGVVSAAVYVVCELAHHNPAAYLSLTPQLFHILTSSSNNWVLIKVVKLLGSLVPLEPRLSKKLLQPLTDIINTTPAKSLLYECVNTLLSGDLSAHKAALQLCLQQLKLFVEDKDQNLKYLGLLGLHKLLQRHLLLVAEHRELVLTCLDDADITIRMRALDLLTAMATARNTQVIAAKLVAVLFNSGSSSNSYRDAVLQRLIAICSHNSYANVTDFEWYVDMLLQLTQLQGVAAHNSNKINQQLLDVAVRVPDVRDYLVARATRLLLQQQPQDGSSSNRSSNLLFNKSNSMCVVLYSAAFVVGEFAEHLDHTSSHSDHNSNGDRGNNSSSNNIHHQLIDALLQPINAVLLPVVVLQVFMQAAFKLFTNAMSRCGLQQQASEAEATTTTTTTAITADDIAGMCSLMIERYTCFTQDSSSGSSSSSNAVVADEVQARAACYVSLLRWLSNYCNFSSSDNSSDAVVVYVDADDSMSAATAAAAQSSKSKTANLLHMDDLMFDPDTNQLITNAATAATTVTTATSAALEPSATTAASHLIRVIATQLEQLFADAMNPVNTKAQRKVPWPAATAAATAAAAAAAASAQSSSRSKKNSAINSNNSATDLLDLNTAFNKQWCTAITTIDTAAAAPATATAQPLFDASVYGSDDESNSNDRGSISNSNSTASSARRKLKQQQQQDAAHSAQASARRAADPFYLKAANSNSRDDVSSNGNSSSSSSGAVLQLEGVVGVGDVPVLSVTKVKSSNKHSSSSSHNSDWADIDSSSSSSSKKHHVYSINTADDMPVGANNNSDDEQQKKKKSKRPSKHKEHKEKHSSSSSSKQTSNGSAEAKEETAATTVATAAAPVDILSLDMFDPLSESVSSQATQQQQQHLQQSATSSAAPRLLISKSSSSTTAAATTAKSVTLYRDTYLKLRYTCSSSSSDDTAIIVSITATGISSSNSSNTDACTYSVDISAPKHSSVSISNSNSSSSSSEDRSEQLLLSYNAVNSTFSATNAVRFVFRKSLTAAAVAAVVVHRVTSDGKSKSKSVSITVPMAAMMVATPITAAAFGLLLQGDSSSSSSSSAPTMENSSRKVSLTAAVAADFRALVAAVCSELHLTCVEQQQDSSAMLHGTLQKPAKHHNTSVCVLLKLKRSGGGSSSSSNTLIVDVKAVSSSAANAVAAEVAQLLSAPES